ncbi:uncharacterized protein LOC124266959 [Haliotis rubra]|uniref:uncharacterized protein LOC124266959 n=1 Tax=Haliotis rubra TaxID=36100 RepID=UPI001EE4FD30|nr:uncharacterized protein LOC124266959 [Haliotis rubra]
MLLPDKSQATYTIAFQLLRAETERLHLHLQPPILQIGFEKAVANAAHAVFDGVEIRGCYFHYAQALWRKIQNRGLTSRYKEDADFRQLALRANTLPLAPLDQSIVGRLILSEMEIKDNKGCRKLREGRLFTKLTGIS